MAFVVAVMKDVIQTSECLVNHLASNCGTLNTCYRKHKLAKKKAYESRIQEVEHNSFTPLMLSATGGMGHEGNVFYKRLAALLSDKWKDLYAEILGWIRCRLSFCLLHSAI